MQTLGFIHSVTDLKEYFPYRAELCKFKGFGKGGMMAKLVNEMFGDFLSESSTETNEKMFGFFDAAY